LTELARLLPATKNYNVAVREWGEQIVFLRKIVAGGTDKSYGIQVARLAGLPAPVLKRAKEILRQLEEDNLDDIGQPKLAKARQKKEKARDVLRELDLFGRGEM
jgi:DNA mismatch repair protein MutS